MVRHRAADRGLIGGIAASLPRRGAVPSGYDYRTLLTYRLLVLSNTLGKGAVRFYTRRFRIPLAEWRLVAALALHSAITVNALSLELSVDKGWVSRTVAALMKKGLVKGRLDARDRRRVLLSLTREGKALYAEIVPEARRRQASLLSVVTAKERQVFEAVLAKLQHRASEMLT